MINYTKAILFAQETEMIVSLDQIRENSSYFLLNKKYFILNKKIITFLKTVLIKIFKKKDNTDFINQIIQTKDTEYAKKFNDLKHVIKLTLTLPNNKIFEIYLKNFETINYPNSIYKPRSFFINEVLIKNKNNKYVYCTHKSAEKVFIICVDISNNKYETKIPLKKYETIIKNKRLLSKYYTQKEVKTKDDFIKDKKVINYTFNVTENFDKNGQITGYKIKDNTTPKTKTTPKEKEKENPGINNKIKDNTTPKTNTTPKEKEKKNPGINNWGWQGKNTIYFIYSPTGLLITMILFSLLIKQKKIIQTQ